MITQYGTSYDQLSKRIRDDDSARRLYLERRRSNGTASVDPSGMETRRAKYLHAHNGEARRRCARIVFQKMEALVQSLGGNSLLQVTLTPRQYTYGESGTKSFNPDHFQRLVSRYFGKVNMFGIVEPGFYPREQHGGSRGMVSFHLHALAWGSSPVEVRKLAMPFKDRHPSIFVDRPSAYVQVVPVNDVPQVLQYQYKPPNVGYHVYVARLEAIDTETGEVFSWLSNKSKSLKYELRPGERIRIDNSLAGLTFDRLLIATGDEGKAIKKRIKLEALADYQRSL